MILEANRLRRSDANGRLTVPMAATLKLRVSNLAAPLAGCRGPPPSPLAFPATIPLR